MFRKLYKRANECITDEKLKNKVLSAPAHKKTLRRAPLYASAVLAFAVFALVLNPAVFKTNDNASDIEIASFSARQMPPIPENAENLVQYTGVLPYVNTDGVEIIRLDISDKTSVYLFSKQVENSAELIKKAEFTMQNIDLSVPQFKITHNNTILKVSDILNNLSSVVTATPHTLRYDKPFTYVLYDEETQFHYVTENIID